MSTRTDAELIEHTLAGDERAFADLISRHERRVAATIRGVVGDVSDEDAADIAQDIFLLVYRALGSFRGEAKFSTWLTSIAMRYCYRESRRRRRRAATFFPFLRSTDDREPEEERIAGGDRADSSTIAGERRRAVLQALDRLPEEFRAVLTLRVVEEMPVEEVALALGISTGTVKSRLYRAKEKMRELLGGIDIEFE